MDLVAAITSDDLPSVLREQPELANARDEHGVSALLLALYHRRPEARDALLAAGAEVGPLEAAALGDVEKLEAPTPAAATASRRCTWPRSSAGADAVRALLAMGVDAGRRRRQHVRRAPDPLGVRGRRPRQRARAARGRREPERPPAGRLHAAAHRRAQRRRDARPAAARPRRRPGHRAPTTARRRATWRPATPCASCSAREVDLAVRPRAGLRAVDEVQPLDRRPAQPLRRASSAPSPSAGRAGPAWRRARTRPSPPSRRPSSRRSPPGRRSGRSPARRGRRRRCARPPRPPGRRPRRGRRGTPRCPAG